MKEKIAYLRGLMDGMKLADDDNTKLLRTIADCLDAIADEVETESARMDIVEEQLDSVNDELDQYDEIFDALLENDDEDDEDEYEYEDEDDEDEVPFAPDPELIKKWFEENGLPFPPMHGHHHGCCHGHGRHHGPHHHGPHYHGPNHHGCCHGHGHWMDEDEDFNAEEFLDSLNYLTCPVCGEMVALDDEALEKEPDPICPKCNSHIFGKAEGEKPEGEEE